MAFPVVVNTNLNKEFVKKFKPKYLFTMQGSSSYGKYGAPPRPPFMEENDEDEDEENKFVTRDTCYHLLKLYCKRSHRLERLLSPSTSTSHQLDFSLRYKFFVRGRCALVVSLFFFIRNFRFDPDTLCSPPPSPHP